MAFAGALWWCPWRVHLALRRVRLDSQEIHDFETVLQHKICSLFSVHALLTGRVEDGLGGSGPSLSFLRSQEGTRRPRSLAPDRYLRYERTIAISSLAAVVCPEVGLRAGSST